MSWLSSIAVVQWPGVGWLHDRNHSMHVLYICRRYVCMYAVLRTYSSRHTGTTIHYIRRGAPPILGYSPDYTIGEGPPQMPRMVPGLFPTGYRRSKNVARFSSMYAHLLAHTDVSPYPTCLRALPCPALPCPALLDATYDFVKADASQ
ncbi:hypothetical protein BU24DRAFT_278031 [Aaosphaeria arxii CBS 175.79]|uniref:Uncharacterized protein n=1 Tax=Aaosphaeria arxii CBS 175.79 TaxID=1450172 RepID=A0A6A5XE30_9PLEO|nr:uncharacterized protein BU24DRAFT_278031 [Aaosphaeria arxii CBS 175.79]KAF2011292.1 hypothetical protein BU24DRAFT_278031 [Aaosphaeria arxii CBS 175.79]